MWAKKKKKGMFALNLTQVLTLMGHKRLRTEAVFGFLFVTYNLHYSMGTPRPSEKTIRHRRLASPILDQVKIITFTK